MYLLKFINVLWLLAFLPTTTFAQNTYVVSVGIADYQNINALKYTEADVMLFNSIFTEHNANITTLIGAQATHAKVVSVIRDVFSLAKPTDAVILFFSGHGYEGGFCCYDMKQNYHLEGL